eukprot:6186112-Pleurochrysis_carterae.AAC.3
MFCLFASTSKMRRFAFAIRMLGTRSISQRLAMHTRVLAMHTRVLAMLLVNLSSCPLKLIHMQGRDLKHGR